MKNLILKIKLVTITIYNAIIVVGIFIQPSFAEDSTATIRWTIPTERMDGSPLDINEIELYTIKDTCVGTTYVEDPSVTTIDMEFIPPECHYTMTATLKDGMKSDMSDFSTAKVKPNTSRPKSPGTISVTVTVEATVSE